MINVPIKETNKILMQSTSANHIVALNQRTSLLLSVAVISVIIVVSSLHPINVLFHHLQDLSLSSPVAYSSSQLSRSKCQTTFVKKYSYVNAEIRNVPFPFLLKY